MKRLQVLHREELSRICFHILSLLNNLYLSAFVNTRKRWKFNRIRITVYRADILKQGFKWHLDRTLSRAFYWFSLIHSTALCTSLKINVPVCPAHLPGPNWASHPNFFTPKDHRYLHFLRQISPKYLNLAKNVLFIRLH